ncbi:Ig-like domain-containing protein [Mycoplasma sp. 4013]
MRKRNKLLTSLLFISASTTAIAVSCGSQTPAAKPETPGKETPPSEQTKPGNQIPPDEGSKPSDGTPKPGGETTNPGEETKPGQGNGSQTQNPGGSGERGNKPSDGSGTGTTTPEDGTKSGSGNPDGSGTNRTQEPVVPKKEAASVVAIDANNLYSQVNKELSLPYTVQAYYSDGTTKEVPVSWEISKIKKETPAVYQITGTVAGKQFVKEYEVYNESAFQIENPYITVYENDKVTLPETVKVISKFGTFNEPVVWNEHSSVSTAKGTQQDITIQGHLKDYTNRPVTAYLKVVDNNYTTNTSTNIVDTNASDVNHATATVKPAKTGSGDAITNIVDGTWNSSENRFTNYAGDRQADAKTGQITIDLKTKQDIAGVKLFMFADFNTGNNGPKYLYISTSEDGQTFHRVFNQSKSDNFALNTSANIQDANNSNNYVITFEKVNAQYIRFDYENYPRDDTHNYVFGLREVFVYGATKAQGHREKDSSNSLDSIVVNGHGITTDTSTLFSPDKLDYNGTSSPSDNFPTEVDFNLPQPSRARVQTFSIQIDANTKKWYALVWSETGQVKTYTYTHRLLTNTKKLTTVAFSVPDITIGQAQPVIFNLIANDNTKIEPKDLDKNGIEFHLVNNQNPNIYFSYQSGNFIGRHFTNAQQVVMKVTYQGISYTSAPVSINVLESPTSPFSFRMDELAVAKTQTLDVLKGDNITLPKYIEAIYPGDKYARYVDVTWNNVPTTANNVGFFTYSGTATYRNLTRTVSAVVAVHDIKSVSDIHISTLSGYAPDLPNTVTVFDDLGRAYTRAVIFPTLSDDELNSTDVVMKEASVAGTNLKAKLYVAKVARSANTTASVVSQKPSTTQEQTSALFPAAFASSTMTASTSQDSSAVTYSVDSLNDGTAATNTTTPVWSNKYTEAESTPKTQAASSAGSSDSGSGKSNTEHTASQTVSDTTDNQEGKQQVGNSSGSTVASVAKAEESKTVKQSETHTDTINTANDNYVGVAFGDSTSKSVKIDRVKVWFAAADDAKKVGIPTTVSVEYLSSAVTGLTDSTKTQLSNLNDSSSTATNLKTGTWTHITLKNQSTTIKSNDYTELIFAKPVDAYAVRIKFSIPTNKNSVQIKEFQVLAPNTNVSKQSSFETTVKYDQNNYPGFNEKADITTYTLGPDQSLDKLHISATNNANIFTTLQDETLIVTVSSEDASNFKTFVFKTTSADALAERRSKVVDKVWYLLNNFISKNYTLTKGSAVYAQAYKVWGMTKTASVTDLEKAWNQLETLMKQD